MKKFLNPKEELVGEFSDNTYTIHKKPEHFMRIFQGFGISDDIIDKLKQLDCNKVIIIYHGKNGIKKLRSNLSQWTDSKKKFIDRSMGSEDPQTFLSERDMEEIQ